MGGRRWRRTRFRLDLPHADAVARVREALAVEGFGVLTEIDVKATMAAKLGVEFEDYVILGACNPALAHRALEVDRSVGRLLPCTVTVRADADGAGSIVDVLDPQVMIAMTGIAGLAPVADEAGARLTRVREALAARPRRATSARPPGTRAGPARRSPTSPAGPRSAARGTSEARSCSPSDPPTDLPGAGRKTLPTRRGRPHHRGVRATRQRRAVEMTTPSRAPFAPPRRDPQPRPLPRGARAVLLVLSPLETALRLQRYARTLHALADRWVDRRPRAPNRGEPVPGGGTTSTARRPSPWTAPCSWRARPTRRDHGHDRGASDRCRRLRARWRVAGRRDAEQLGGRGLPARGRCPVRRDG